ncbi:hypothetical protein [Roseobacter weihaiensis]|uniref:hypothetical protein n=1 Tax=Roseobacter weihaiensis TaxID=2763262 RepID=UPI001D0A9453|nr:hypothetical protein [Roseobacter sp. H9]
MIEVPTDFLEVTEVLSANGDVLSTAQVETSDDGLVVTTSYDRDSDDIYDLSSAETTVLQADGGTTNTIEDRAGLDLHSKSKVTASDNGRDVVTEQDVNGDGFIDFTISSVLIGLGHNTLAKLTVPDRQNESLPLGALEFMRMMNQTAIEEGTLALVRRKIRNNPQLFSSKLSTSVTE